MCRSEDRERTPGVRGLVSVRRDTDALCILPEVGFFFVSVLGGYCCESRSQRVPQLKR